MKKRVWILQMNSQSNSDISVKMSLRSLWMTFFFRNIQILIWSYHLLVHMELFGFARVYVSRVADGKLMNLAFFSIVSLNHFFTGLTQAQFCSKVRHDVENELKYMRKGLLNKKIQSNLVFRRINHYEELARLPRGSPRRTYRRYWSEKPRRNVDDCETGKAQTVWRESRPYKTKLNWTDGEVQ